MTTVTTLKTVTHWNTLKQMQHEFEQKLGKNNPQISRINHSNSEQYFELFLVLTRLAIGLVLKELSGSGDIFPEEPGVFGSSRFREICFENSRDLRITDFCSPTIFSLYVLSSQFRPRDTLQGISPFFFIYYAYPRTGCTCIRRHLKETVLWGINHVV